MTFLDRRHLQHMADVISVLVWRDQKSRYKSTGMGVFWAVASPVLFLLTFYLLFKVVLPLNIPNYASHLFIALVVWTWFQGTTMESVSALPLASATSNLVTLCLTLPLLIVILWFEGAVLGRTILFLPVLVLTQFIFVLSVAYLVAALNVRFRDLQYIVPIILQLGYFATPIFYDVSSVPPTALMYLQLNPMLTLIESYRDILMRNEIPNLGAVFLVFVASCLLLAASYRYFIRESAGFLEEV
jgi:lipopolysaccharide transport system permease protein